jgi:hypothetical protein
MTDAKKHALTSQQVAVVGAWLPANDRSIKVAYF